jgi:hypothetical protein
MRSVKLILQVLQTHLLPQQNKLFLGAINEVNTIATQNASALAAFDAQHDTTTGFHEVIITQADAGFDSDDRFIMKNAAGSDTLP